MKRDITVTIGLISSYMSLEELERVVREAKQRCLAEGLKHAVVQIDIRRGYYDEVDADVSIVAKRLETDEEEQIRELEEERSLQRQRQNLKKQLTKSDRRSLYEDLKREFEE